MPNAKVLRHAKLLFASLLAAMALLTGCASKPKPAGSTPMIAAAPPSPSGGVIRIAPNRELTEAAMQPFADIGLTRKRPPQALANLKSPYSTEGIRDCATIAEAIAALDFLLGNDVDVQLAERTLRQKGMAAAGDALVDAVESTSTSVIPFRGVVRELSGASKRDRRIAAAIQAGKLRRAFLKGMGQAQNCSPPAAPLPYKEQAD